RRGPAAAVGHRNRHPGGGSAAGAAQIPGAGTNLKMAAGSLPGPSGPVSKVTVARRLPSSCQQVLSHAGSGPYDSGVSCRAHEGSRSVAIQVVTSSIMTSDMTPHIARCV